MYREWTARRHLRPRTGDALLAAMLLAVDVVVAARQVPQRVGGSTAIGALILLAASVPIIWRRRHPLAVLVPAFAALLSHEALGYPEAPLLGAMVALYSVGAYVSWRSSAIAASVAIASYLGLRLYNVARYGDSLVELLPNLAVVLMVWIVGVNVRRSRAYAADLDRVGIGLRAVRCGERVLASPEGATPIDPCTPPAST